MIKIRLVNKYLGLNRIMMFRDLDHAECYCKDLLLKGLISSWHVVR